MEELELAKPQPVNSSSQAPLQAVVPDSTPPPEQRNSRFIRFRDLYYAAGIIFCLFWVALGISSHSDGGGWAAISMGFWAVILTAKWISFTLLIHFKKHRNNQNIMVSDVGPNRDKRRAYLSLTIGLVEVAGASILLALAFLKELPLSVVLVSLVLLVVAGYASVLAVKYALQTFKTPYWSVGIWALALQGIGSILLLILTQVK